MNLSKVVLRLMKLKYTSIVLGSKHDFLGVNRRWEYFLCNMKEWIFCFLCLTFPKLNSFFIVNSLFSWSQRTAACFAWPQIFFDDMHFYWLLHVHSFQRDLHKYFAICELKRLLKSIFRWFSRKNLDMEAHVSQKSNQGCFVT